MIPCTRRLGLPRVGCTTSDPVRARTSTQTRHFAARALSRRSRHSNPRLAGWLPLHERASSQMSRGALSPRQLAARRLVRALAVCAQPSHQHVFGQHLATESGEEPEVRVQLSAISLFYCKYGLHGSKVLSLHAFTRCDGTSANHTSATRTVELCRLSVIGLSKTCMRTSWPSARERSTASSYTFNSSLAITATDGCICGRPTCTRHVHKRGDDALSHVRRLLSRQPLLPQGSQGGREASQGLLPIHSGTIPYTCSRRQARTHLQRH